MPNVDKQANLEIIEEDLQRLELGLRQLKIQYDRYFNGGLKKPPYELQYRVKKIIKRYAEEPMRKYQQRFHFNGLVTRYNVFSELWGKRIRELEEGVRHGSARPQRPRDVLVAHCVIQDPAKELLALRRLHSAYVEACRTHADGPRSVAFEKFARGVAAQATRLRKDSDSERIELRVVVSDGKVQLRARRGGG